MLIADISRPRLMIWIHYLWKAAACQIFIKKTMNCIYGTRLEHDMGLPITIRQKRKFLFWNPWLIKVLLNQIGCRVIKLNCKIKVEKQNFLMSSQKPKVRRIFQNFFRIATITPCWRLGIVSSINFLLSFLYFREYFFPKHSILLAKP